MRARDPPSQPVGWGPRGTARRAPKRSRGRAKPGVPTRLAWWGSNHAFALPVVDQSRGWLWLIWYKALPAIGAFRSAPAWPDRLAGWPGLGGDICERPWRGLRRAGNVRRPDMITGCIFLIYITRHGPGRKWLPPFAPILGPGSGRRQMPPGKACNRPRRLWRGMAKKPSTPGVAQYLYLLIR